MSTSVVLVVLTAGLVHAVWNALAKSQPDQFASFALLNAGVALVCWVALPIVGLPRSASWTYLGVSVLCHLGYELFLMGAYRRADFSRSYPIARGVAPLLVSLGGLVFANEHLSPRSLAGMLVIAFAITSLALHRREPATRRLGVVWALATGVAIAIYTVIDGLGVRVSHDAFRYAGALFAIESTLWMIGVFASGRRDWWPTRGRAALGLLAGLLSIVGYVAVLWAQIRAPFGVVSALRETGVLWAAIIGVVVFREGRVRRIIVPAMLVTLGIALVSIG